LYIEFVDEWMRMCGTDGVVFTSVRVPGTLAILFIYCRSLPIAETLFTSHTWHCTALVFFHCMLWNFQYRKCFQLRRGIVMVSVIYVCTVRGFWESIDFDFEHHVNWSKGCVPVFSAGFRVHFSVSYFRNSMSTYKIKHEACSHDLHVTCLLY